MYRLSELFFRFCAVALLGCTITAANATVPMRIVSLDVCVDQILVALVARARIVAVTGLATDPTISATPEAFAGIPTTTGDAEDVLTRDPDLIITGPFAAVAGVDLLRRLGRRVVIIAAPQTVSGVRDAITAVAAAVGEPAAGARLVATFDDRLAGVEARINPALKRPRLLIVEPNNYVAAAGSLMDDALHRAGYENASDPRQLLSSGQMSLEQVLATQPDLVVLAAAPETYATPLADNLRHPALARLLRREVSRVLPWPLWLCGTQHLASAIEDLATAREGLPAATSGSVGP